MLYVNPNCVAFVTLGCCSHLKPSNVALLTAGPEPGPPGPTPGAGCSSAMDKKGCGKEKGCVWCEGSFGPGSCYEEVGHTAIFGRPKVVLHALKDFQLC
jgi:hypothetical protein